MGERNLILSVDGGGTTSQVAVYKLGDEDLMDSTQVGPLSCKSSPSATVVESLEGLKAFYVAYGDKIACAVLGLSGLDNEADFQNMLQLLMGTGMSVPDAEVPEGINFSCGRVTMTPEGFPVLLCPDSALPIFGCGISSGSVLISGTGSVAVHINQDGDMSRFGGWGYRASDNGSGYWVGSAYMRFALQSADHVAAGGGVEEGEDAELVREAATAISISGDTSESTIMECVEALRNWSMTHDDPKDFASLARTAIESTTVQSAKVRKRGAKYLADLAMNACVGNDEPLVVFGGIFGNPEFEQMFRDEFAKIDGGSREVVRCNRQGTYGAFSLGRHLISR